MKRLVAALALLLPLAPGHLFGQDDLAAGKDLYVAAKYEEALAVFDRLKAAKPASQAAAVAVEQYRAICLLALNRKEEAEHAIEAVADLDPFYQPAEDDAAPWVRAAFRDARRKVLPAALQRLYGRGKDLYDRKAMPEAVAAFQLVLRLLDDPDLTLDGSAKSDMRMVTRGFLDLSQAAAASAKPAAPPDPAAASNATGTPSAGAPPPRMKAPATATPSPAKTTPNGATTPGADPTIYDAAASGVTPPLPLRRDVPNWPFAPRGGTGGAVVVELIVRENGTIESAVVRESAGKFYDQLVLQSAKNWLYRPATREGVPVKYRLLVRVVISA